MVNPLVLVFFVCFLFLAVDCLFSFSYGSLQKIVKSFFVTLRFKLRLLALLIICFLSFYYFNQIGSQDVLGLMNFFTDSDDEPHHLHIIQGMDKDVAWMLVGCMGVTILLSLGLMVFTNSMKSAARQAPDTSIKALISIVEKVLEKEKNMIERLDGLYAHVYANGDGGSRKKCRRNSDGKQAVIDVDALKQEIMAELKDPPPLGNQAQCKRCLSYRHKTSECVFLSKRCFTCQSLGHAAWACKNFVILDKAGRVQTRVETTPSVTKVTYRQDRTHQDKMATAESLIKAVKDLAVDRSKKAAQKRKDKKEAEKAKEIDGDDSNQVADVNRPEQSPPQEANKVVEMQLGHIIDMFTDLVGIDLEEEGEEVRCNHNASRATYSGHEWFTLDFFINGRHANWIVDSGAKFSVVGTTEARRCGLKPSGKTVKLIGIGSTEAWLSEPVTISWKGINHKASICVVETLNFPSLLGIEELKALGIRLTCQFTTVYAAAVEDKQQLREAESKNVDVASGVDLSLSDEEVLQRKLKELEDRLGDQLSATQRVEILDIFRKWSKCWLRPASGQIKAKAKFTVTGRAVRDKLRPLTPAMREELTLQVDSMLKAGVIRKSERSSWGSVPVFVQKKDGGWRMAIDYRRVNQQLKFDAYPIPLVWDNLQSVAGHRYYTCLDGMWGFWNVPLEEASKEVTTLLTHFGNYEFNVIPFGIKNSPGEFQRAMDNLFGDMYYEGLLCYIDDIVVYSNDWETHKRLVEEVLRRCSEGGLFLKVTKSNIGEDEVLLLGHRVSYEGIRPDKRKVEALYSAAAPTNKAELMSFLGTAGYLRRFIPNFSELSKPLTDLCKKKAEWTWSKEQRVAFNRLRNTLSEVILLSAPRGGGTFVIVCDASSVAVGAALLQVQNDELVILEFASKKFSGPELNWAVREKEAFAIRWSVEHFSMYLRGMDCLVLTDHSSLQWLGNASAGKLQRWALYLQQFQLEIRSIGGGFNVIADWLSRSTNKADFADEGEQIYVPVWAVTDPVYEFDSAPYVPSRQDLISAMSSAPESDLKWCVQKDNLWYNARTFRLYVPPPLREPLMYWFHASPLGGHMGVARTFRRMKCWVFWPKMKVDIAKYISQCLPCKRVGAPAVPYLKDVLTRPFPGQLVSVDHVGPREWLSQKVWYLVLIDHCSRFVMANVVSSTGSEEVIQCFSDRWMPVMGAPEAILCDRGSAFVSSAFRKFVLTQMNSMIVYTSVHYPQGNALNEASHRGIEAALKTRSQYDNASSFADALRDSVLAYNCTPHSGTGVSPFFALFGMEIALPGWQRYSEKVPMKIRQARTRDLRMRLLMKSVLLADERVRLQPEADGLSVGDWVVFFKSDYERQKTTSELGLVKYTTEWSAPVKVVDLKGDSVVVSLADEKDAPTRQVPRRLIRKVICDVSESLTPLNTKVLEMELARFALRPPWSTARKRIRTAAAI